MNIHLLTEYADEVVTIEKREYPNGRVALLAVSSIDEPVMTLTVNLPHEDIPDGFVAIKDYSENEGALDCLIQNAVIGEPMGYVKSGFTNIPICKLLM